MSSASPARCPCRTSSSPIRTRWCSSRRAFRTRGTGWGGRIADTMQTSNGVSTYPPAVSIGAQSLFCTAAVVESAGLQPGNNLSQDAMNFWPPAAAAARSAAQQEIIDFNSGLSVVQAAKGVMNRARQLNQVLSSASGTGPTTPFPQTTLGNQLAEVARIINLRATLGLAAGSSARWAGSTRTAGRTGSNGTCSWS